MLSKKDKANPLLMESRKLLLNQVDVGEDGRLNAVDEIRTFRYGAAEGEHKVRISGITTRDFFYRTKYNRTKAVYQASEAMKNIGRRANLECMDDAAACIVKSPIFYPVVIVFYENSDGRMQLSAFTAKSFTALWAINSVLKRFDRQLPDAMVRKVSVHSVHDVNRAIIHGLKSLIRKDDGDDDGDYVDLKKLFKSGKRNQMNLYDGRQKERDERREDLEERRQSQKERKARRKEKRLEKKREAARRKYEKLMGEELVITPAGEQAVETSVNDGYSEETDEDIMREFTGLSSDDLYDNYTG